MPKRDGLPEVIGEGVATVIGLVICLTILGGAYVFGYAVAHYFSAGEHRQAFGLLTAIAVIWLYEHRIAHERWQRRLNQ